MSQFYGLPKDHKPGLPLRPVVSSCGSATSNISLLLERILNQLLPFVPAHLGSTAECVQALREVGPVSSDCIVASLDVASLYSNIPIVESVDVAMELLAEHQHEVDMFYLTIPDVRQLLKFVLTSNYFAFGNDVYRQRKGLAMGNHLAPPLAIIFMSKLETEALDLSPQKPRLYKRYIDDCILVWLHGLSSLLRFVEFMNDRHPDIKFTLEHTEQNDEHTISYLDLSVFVDDGNINWELFMKPSHSGVHLSYDSTLPCEVKKSVAIEQFRRAQRNSSTAEGRLRGIEKIEGLLQQNDFPIDIIQWAKQSTNSQQEHVQRGQRSQQSQKRDQGAGIIKLPFVNDRLARRIRQTVRSFSKDVRVVFFAGRSLKDMLVSSTFGVGECPKVAYKNRKKRGRGRPPECRACDAGMSNGQCLAKNVVYSMCCSLCAAEYVGETERAVRDRFQEHFRQACAHTPGTPWGGHYSSQHPNATGSTPFNKATILAREPSRVNRRILEATFIRERCPAVNNDCGWKLIESV